MIMMPTAVTAIKADNNFQFMAFLRIKSPGIDKVTVAVMKARAVQSATPLQVIASTTGITLTELAYKGAPIMTAKGTVHQVPRAKYVSTKLSGTKPWIKAPKPTP